MTHKAESLHTILPEKKDGAISSVIILPEKLEFETQNPNERVYIMLRKHIITNFGWVVMTAISILIPIGVLIFLKAIDADIYESFSLTRGQVLSAIVMWYVLIITNAFMKFLDWYFNIYVITSERVIDFDFSPFAYHKISEAGLESIVDATQENIGFFPMLFNFGDVYVQTAGERREFDFLSVSKPAWVRDKIMDLRDLMVKKPK
ncbi:hypothetical protein JW766_01135 [Candidatus Dojkabacteria bacterium]|nr:hypothetical protein [Candidatus Dojkabacteria bacterium]